MKLNRGGLILGGIYLALGLSLFAFSRFGTLDGKGMYIFGQFAVAPALMLFTYTGIIAPLMKALPWLNNFPVLFAVSFTIMYLIGWGFSSLALPSRRDHRDPI
jgi:hypothetical protein